MDKLTCTGHSYNGYRVKLGARVTILIQGLRDDLTR